MVVLGYYNTIDCLSQVFTLTDGIWFDQKEFSFYLCIYKIASHFCCKTGIVFSLGNLHIITRINNYIILTVIILQLILVLSVSQYV